MWYDGYGIKACRVLAHDGFEMQAKVEISGRRFMRS
jgi:hypothetical protein